jgi:hypothetical protein
VLTAFAPEHRTRQDVRWISGSIECGEHIETLSAPGEDDFEALTGLLQRLADRLLEISRNDGVQIYWRSKGDLEGGAFWGEAFAPWEIAVRSKLDAAFSATNPDLPKVIAPSVRIAIDDSDAIHLFRVRPDGSDELGHEIVAEAVSKMEPDEVARLIGFRILAKTAAGRSLYRQGD